MVKKKKRKKRYSSISKHKKYKSKLVSPMQQLKIEVMDWQRNFLPEHIWIEFLSNTYQKNIWLSLYNNFLDELDKYCPQEITIYGFISDFGLIPSDKRNEFIKNNENLIYDAFYKPFGRIIAFYPEAPCYWLIQKKWLENDGHLDPFVELPKLSNCIIRLFPGKDLHAGHIRAVPFNRMLKKRHIKINEKEIIDLLLKYPTKCSEEEKYRVQQFARIMMNFELQQSKQYKAREWPKYFWRHNLDLVPCTPYPISFEKKDSLSKDDVKLLHDRLKKNIEIAIEYLDEIAMKYKYDLYNTGRDEILLGLFSRLTRLYVFISLNSNLWARDIAAILLRCLTDTAITFAYLAKAGTEKDFNDFISYGEGKEKLLMLHIQDTYPSRKTLEGRSPKDIANELGGGFTPELIDIELGNWTKKSARDLAKIAGLEEFYKLVYDPTSSDIHGTWVSLKNSNLTRCIQPLHRFHRMPNFYELPLFVNMVDAVQRIYLTCVDIGIHTLQFPDMKSQLVEVTSFSKVNALDK